MKQDRASRKRNPGRLGSKRGRQVLSCGGNRTKTHPYRPPSRGLLTGRGPSSYMSSRLTRTSLGRERVLFSFFFQGKAKEPGGRLCKCRVGKSHLQSVRACMSRQEWEGDFERGRAQLWRQSLLFWLGGPPLAAACLF